MVTLLLTHWSYRRLALSHRCILCIICSDYFQSFFQTFEAFVSSMFFVSFQGVVSGVLLVTPNAIMFDPNVSDPLVIEHGADIYGMIAPMETVISAAMYHDIAAMKLKGVPRSVDMLVLYVHIHTGMTRFAPSRWETALLCNDVSHWLSASLESALYIYICICIYSIW